MTNNSQVLQNLVKSAQSIEKENERLTSEILQQSLNDLNKNLTTTFNQKLDITTKEIQNRLYNSEKTPLAFKWSNLAMSFILGMLTMTILSGIVWYQWIRPYQVSKENTAQTKNGEIYIHAPKSQAIEQNNEIYIQIK